MSRLDRLSALLDGLAPQIRVCGNRLLPTSDCNEALPEDRLSLYLLLEGALMLRRKDGLEERLVAPGLAVWRGDQAGLPALAADDHRGLCLEARFAGPAAALLLEAFDQPLLIALGEDCVELNLIVPLIAGEMAAPRCGQPAMLERAGGILFIGLLRHLIAHPRPPAGMLNGLGDPRIARALVAVHERAQASWTLERLADVAGMSRTAFAMRFRELMNATPGAYLARLRLAIARREIARGNGLKQAARESGYASSSALSRALSRQQTPAGVAGV